MKKGVKGMFNKILIANRGAIAVRIIRTLRSMGISSVAVYTTADRDSLHVEFADEAVLIGEGPAKESYVNAELILQVARETGADAIHPGYGFLSENALLPEPAWSKESRLSGQHLTISSCSALSIRPVPWQRRQGFRCRGDRPDEVAGGSN